MARPASTDASPSGPRADRKRTAIVEAARALFLAEGYDASMDALAAAADVSKATLYNHFGNKEALFAAVIGDALDQALGRAVEEAQEVAGDHGAREALIRTTAVLVRGVTEPDLLALRNLVTGELRRFPQLGEAWAVSGPKRAATMLADLLNRLVEEGELRIPDLDLAIVQLFSLTLYPHLTASSYGSELPAELSEPLLESGVDMFLRFYEP